MIVGVDIRHLAAPNPSGIGIYTLNVIREMARSAPEVRFLLFASGSEQARANLPKFDEPNIALCVVRWPNRIVSSLLKIPKGPGLEDMMYEKPDVWFFPNLNIIRTRLPYVVTIHDMSFRIFPEFFTQKDLAWHRAVNAKRLLKKATHVVAVSESTKHDLEKYYQISKDKITVAYHGAQKRFHNSEEPQDKNFLREHNIDFPYLLSLCTLEPRKNIESILEAYDDWQESNQNETHLVIAGGAGWKTDGIEEVFEKLKHQDKIHFLGYVPDNHKPALYRHASALLFPSFYEGFGLPALEAMASGTPVITSFTGSMPEVVGDAAIMVDPYNVSDLKQALDELMSDVELRKKLIDSGIKRAQKFTWEKTAKKTLSALYLH
ncbi:MAG: glycosyltransferase family 1 protein [Patescibacteria group bacterium]